MVRITIILASLLALAGAWSSASADLNVQGWGLAVEVDDPETSTYISHAFTTVVNPFLGQHSVALPNSPATTAAAQYDVSWLVNYGDFNISAQLAAQDGHHVISEATGTIIIHTDTEAMLQLTGNLTYSLPGFSQVAHISFQAFDPVAHEWFLQEGESFSTDLQYPASGTLNIAGSAPLPAGRNIRLQYYMILDTGGFSSTLAEAGGGVNMILTPEPACLVLFASLFLVLPRHTARRSLQR